MSAPALPTLAPNGPALLAARPALAALLSGLLMLAFSSTGRRNLCRRFHLTDEELEAVLTAYEHSTHLADAA